MTSHHHDAAYIDKRTSHFEDVVTAIMLSQKLKENVRMLIQNTDDQN